MAEELRKAQDQYSAQTSPSKNAIEDRSVYIERLKEQIEKAYKERIQQLEAQRKGDEESLNRLDWELETITGKSARSTVNELLVEYTTVVDDTVAADKRLYSTWKAETREGDIPAIGN